MAKITAICNQKGGVGKTATAVNLGIGIAREDKRVLLVDLDQLETIIASVLGQTITGYTVPPARASSTTRRVWTFSPPTSSCLAWRSHW